MYFNDLAEVKRLLDIDPLDTQEDAKLWLYIETATEVIETYINRKNIMKRARTEYLNGTNTSRLCLNHRPVYSTPQPVMYYSGSSLGGTSADAFDNAQVIPYGQSYYLEVDDFENGVSHSGILRLARSTFRVPFARSAGMLSPYIISDTGSYKVTYTGGYTLDNLPSAFRQACALLVAKMRFIFPLGLELSSDSFEGVSASIMGNQKDYLQSLIKPLLFTYRNRRFG